MSNLRLVSVNNVQSVENKLIRMKELSDSIKVLEAEYNQLKDQVIVCHFNDNEEYRTNKGLLLASYKGVSSQIFQGAKFKVAHPELAKAFTEEKISFRFLLK